MSRKHPGKYDRVIRRLLGADFGKVSDATDSAQITDMHASDCLRFLAGLHLLASGDERQGSVIQNPTPTKARQILAADVKLPVGFVPMLSAWERSDTSSRFDVKTETDTGNPDTARWVLASVSVDACKALKTADIPDLESPLYAKRIFAAGMLESLGALCSKPEYETNPLTLTIQRCSGENIVSAFMECLADGKVSACPRCGLPVFMPRASSTPFCSKQHQVRYHENAHGMLRKGASVDEVSSAFPYISRETISSWQNW